MTASLPMPREADPDEPDGGAASARVVRLTAHPGPPPPLPPDVLLPELDIPPRPPLPMPARTPRTETEPEIEPTTEAEPQATPDAMADPQSDLREEAAPETQVDQEEPTIREDPPEGVAAPIDAVDPVIDDLSVEEIAPAVEDEPVDEDDTVVEDDPVEDVAPVTEDEPIDSVAPVVEAEPVDDVAAMADADPEQGIAPVVEPESDVPLMPSPLPVAVSGDEPAVGELPDTFSPAVPDGTASVLELRGVTKSFGGVRAVEGIDLTVPVGTFYGLVGPNGAGKTTTLSMIAGLLRPDKGSITVGGVDAVARPRAAKRMMGVLPDRLRTFDRLTGRQLLYYYGALRGLRPAIIESRTADLARAFDLVDALGRVVSDYSAGMLKKVMLAGALIHAPRLLVLDEPFEAVDPVSSAVILDILSTYVAHGGTVILSSHGMELVERVCSRVAVIVAGQVLAEGTVEEVRGELTLEQRFIELAGGLSDVEGLEWLHTFSD